MIEQPTFAPRAEVRITGVTLAADVSDHVMSLRCETSLDLAGSFSLELYNPDNQLLDSALFDLGKTVEIHMGYGHTLQPMMLGEITSLEPSFPAAARRRCASAATTSPTGCATTSRIGCPSYTSPIV